MATIPSISLIPSGYKAGKVYSVLPTDGSGDLTFARASTATRINKNNLIENVGNNVPRLDYEGGGCPSLLLEGNSTNLITQSELFDNAYWTKSGATVTSGFSAPSVDSPLGAFKLVEDTSNGKHSIFTPTITSITPSTEITNSVFVKSSGSSLFAIRDLAIGNYAVFNLNTQTVVDSTDISNKIQYLNNGWYKVSSTILSSGTGTTRAQFLILDDSYTSGNPNVNYQGDGTSGVYIFGAQLEQKSYATSYIKTSGSQITRLAETANGSGNASTFNDSEGVLMANISALSNDGTNRVITIGDNSSGNAVSIQQVGSNQIIGYVNVGGVNQCAITASVPTVFFNKCLIKYKANDFSFWVNGFEIGADANGVTFPSGTLNRLNFDVGYASSSPFYGKTKDLRVYKTALTSLEIETLTSYSSFNEMALNFNYTI